VVRYAISFDLDGDEDDSREEVSSELLDLYDLVGVCELVGGVSAERCWNERGKILVIVIAKIRWRKK
jgi:hypothetical protein